MAKKFLGKVVAGAALGGAALLVGAPGIALADMGPTPPHKNPSPHGEYGQRPEDGQRPEYGQAPEYGQRPEYGQSSADGGPASGWATNHVFTNPQRVQPGQKITLGEVCSEKQKDPYVWSEVTGKVPLHEARGDEQWSHQSDAASAPDTDSTGPGASMGGRGPWGGSDSPSAPASQPSWGGYGGGFALDGKDEHGKDEKGKDEYGKDKKGKDEKGKDEYGKDEKGKEHFTYLAEYTISRSTKPGTYKLKGSCGEGELVVVPVGSVAGGTGGDMVNKGLATGGAGALAAAAITGVVLLRRRRTDGSVA